MNADLADPRWAYVWSAYAVTLIVVGALVFAAWRRARFWAKRADQAERGERPGRRAAP